MFASKKLLPWNLLGLILAMPAFGLNLESALGTAQTNSHELKTLKLESQVAQITEQREMAAYLPRLDFNARHLFWEKWEELAVPFGGSTFVMPAIQPYTSVGVTGSLNLFNGFETTYKIEAARLSNQATTLLYQRQDQKIKADIRTLFYRALGAQILVNVADQNVKTLESHLSDIKTRVRNGVSTKFDNLRVEVQLEEAKTDRLAAESSVAVSRAKLFSAIGMADDGKALEGLLPENFSAVKLNEVKKELTNRSDRTALEMQKSESIKLSEAEKSHWLPKVALYGDVEFYNNYNHSITGDDERFKKAYALGVQLDWNIYDGGVGRANERLATVNAAITAEKIAQFDENLTADLEEAKRRFSYDVTNYQVKLTSIRKAEEAVRLARGGVKAGTQTNTEVLDAVVDLNRAKASAVRSQIDAIEALGQLELSVGHSLL